MTLFKDPYGTSYLRNGKGSSSPCYMIQVQGTRVLLHPLCRRTTRHGRDTTPGEISITKAQFARIKSKQQTREREERARRGRNPPLARRRERSTRTDAPRQILSTLDQVEPLRSGQTVENDRNIDIPDDDFSAANSNESGHTLTQVNTPVPAATASVLSVATDVTTPIASLPCGGHFVPLPSVTTPATGSSAPLPTLAMRQMAVETNQLPSSVDHDTQVSSVLLSPVEPTSGWWRSLCEVLETRTIAAILGRQRSVGRPPALAIGDDGEVDILMSAALCP